jgi:hypothetical protein
MTSDARVAVLFGLLSILIISFLIGGLRILNVDPKNDIPAWVMVMNDKKQVLIEERRRVIKQIDLLLKKQQQRKMIENNKDGSGEQIRKLKKEIDYIVKSGDNLSSIAKKFYGVEEGNRLINVQKIFEANRETLKSPDEVYIGQKLLIPPLEDAEVVCLQQK